MEPNVEQNVLGGCNRSELEFRSMYVTHVSCGPEYTMCAGLGMHDGVASVFSWGKTHSRRHFDFKTRTVDDNDCVSNLVCGIPHDLSKELPQEVLRFRPHRKLSSAVVSAFKMKTRVSTFSLVSTPLLFFPLNLTQYYKSEWKRWMFDHSQAVQSEITKSKYSTWHRALEGRFKRLSSRSIPVLEQKEKALFEKFALILRKFGESCDRAAVMKQQVIKDMSDLLDIPNHYDEQESTIPIDDVILAFVEDARRCNTVSTLEPLCFNDFKPNKTKTKSNHKNKGEKNNKKDESSHANRFRGMRSMLHTKNCTIPNDVAWADILNIKHDSETDLALGEAAFGELWREYRLLSQEQLKLRKKFDR